MGYPPLPAQSAHLCQYAAFLARSLKPSSILGYLNIIGVLHKEFNLPNPLTDNWLCSPYLLAFDRLKGNHLPRSYLSRLTCCWNFILNSTCALVLMPPFGLFVWCPFMACFVKAISLLNLRGPWTPPSSFYGQIFATIPEAPWLLFAGAKQSSFVSRWYNFPFLLFQGLPSAQWWPLNVHGILQAMHPPTPKLFHI